MDKLQNEINKLPFHKKQYIYYRFPEVKFEPNNLTEEEFLVRVSRKTMNTYNRFARTEQFRRIEALVLQERMSKNIFKIYEETSEKALTGDSKAIADMLKLKKAVDEIIKETENVVVEVEEEYEDDDLI